MSQVNDKIRLLLDQILHEGQEVGLQVAAYLNGKLVVDCWAGTLDPTSCEPVTGDSLFQVRSTAKGVTASCIHLLADRGHISYDDPIAKFWPEFGVHGKEKATIKDALTHRVAVPQDPASFESQPTNWELMCAEIAAMMPEWQPGSQTGYHAMTYGWILGEVLHRVDGRPINQFLWEEICLPLDTGGLFFGISESDVKRTATLTGSPQALTWNRADIRSAHVPSCGTMNARSLARLYALLSEDGELDSVRLLSENQIRTATELQTDEQDVQIGASVRKALGYWMGKSNWAVGSWAALDSSASNFGHAGVGGSVAYANRERRFAFAFTKNFWGRTQGEPTASRIAKAVESELGFS
jgi:CubicO group peptidase (beta-lactamase class C family)